MEGEPKAGWEGASGVKVAILLGQEAKSEAEGAMLCVAINVQGKLQEEEARKAVGQYLYNTGADWAIASETRSHKGMLDTFGTYAARYSSLEADEGEGMKGGVAHYYPKEMRGQVEWWEPMRGRILVAKLKGEVPRWIIGVYGPAGRAREGKVLGMGQGNKDPCRGQRNTGAVGRRLERGVEPGS